MSKIDLISQQWCDLVFEGRNKSYGAYKLRSQAGRRQRNALVAVLIFIAVIALIPVILQVTKSDTAAEDNYSEVMKMAQLKQEKKEEKKEEKIEVKYQKPIEKVAVKASIQMTAPVIKEDQDVNKEAELKNMEELMNTKAAIAATTYKGDEGGTVNIDDLKENQTVGGTAGQEIETDVFTVAEQMPIFPGGEAALLRYVSEHTKYPSIALEQEIQGVVTIRFVVTPTGAVGDVFVVQGLDPECDREAVRVVKSLPRFTPGKQQGKPVAVWYTLPVRFEIR